MKLTSITVSRTWNLGNYESKRAEVTIELEPGDSVEQARDAAWRTVLYLANEEQEKSE